jgi:MATE family multidrug resistance protein
MKPFNRLKRIVAPGLHWLAGGRRSRPDAGLRQDPSPARTTMQALVALAWPIAAAMLGETAIGLVDTKLVGALGASALAGVGLASVLMHLNYSMVFGLMRGVKVRTAYAVGQGRAHEGVRYAQAGVAMGVLAGVVVFLLARDATWLLEHMGIDPETVPYARDFLAARTFGAPATCMISALFQWRQGMGDTRTPMWIGLGGNVINATLAYGLIYGHFGLPALGVAGAGYGTAITEWIEVAVILALLVREKRALRSDVTVLPLRAAAREVAGLGVPTGLHFGLEMLAFTTFTAVLGSIGAQELAAHHIALNTLRASFLPGVAVAEAASVMVGQALGRRQLAEADRVTRAALLLAVSFMTVCGFLFAGFGGSIARTFTSDHAVVLIAQRLLLVAAVFQTLDAVNMVFRGALRGAKDVRWVAVMGVTVAWSCVPGAAFLLGRHLGWGALGGWFGFIAETALGATLLGWRWHRGAWRTPYLTPQPASGQPALATA